jgi:hypothetical protein
MPKNILLTFLLLGAIVRIYPQTITRPNFALKSHPTLEIESVVLTAGSTTLFMVIENKSLDGTFCADKNIFIVLPNRKRLKIKEARDIPRCPDSYVFKSFGEKLYFSLIFPALPKGTLWFDLLEDCDEACFSFNSVILDTGLNQKIDHAYSVLESGERDKASLEFESLLPDLSGKKCPYEGAVYWNLIQLARQMGDEKKSAEWLEMLRKSDNPLKERLIENLKNN